MALAEALKSNTTLKTLESAALPSNPPAHASRSFPALRASVHLTPFLVPWKHLNTRPARALHATSHSLRVSRTSPARAQPTHSLHTHRASCLLAAAATASHAPAPHVDRGHALLCPRVGGERARTLPLATCPSQAVEQRPRRRRRAGPQSGRPRRPRAGALASPPAAASSCMYLEQAATVRDTTGLRRRGRGVPTSYG